MASIFQTSYRNALLGKNALGSTSSLASSALFGTLAPGSNPLDPLQGQTAVIGLGSFVAGLQQSYAARKAAAAAGSSLGDTSSGSSSSGMSSSDMLSALSSMLGMLGGGSGLGGGSALLSGFGGASSFGGGNTLSFDQTGLSGLTGLNALNGTYQYPGSGSSASAFDVSADQTGGGSLLAQLQSMLSLLMSMMGGSSSAGAGTNSPYSPYGASAANTNSLTGANPLSSPTLFNQQVNMNLIDSAINQTLGSISNTLPMVRM